MCVKSLAHSMCSVNGDLKKNTVITQPLESSVRNLSDEVCGLDHRCWAPPWVSLNILQERKWFSKGETESRTLGLTAASPLPPWPPSAWHVAARKVWREHWPTFAQRGAPERGHCDSALLSDPVSGEAARGWGLCAGAIIAFCREFTVGRGWARAGGKEPASL